VRDAKYGRKEGREADLLLLTPPSVRELHYIVYQMAFQSPSSPCSSIALSPSASSRLIELSRAKTSAVLK
jgi:hypothetical protein